MLVALVLAPAAALAADVQGPIAADTTWSGNVHIVSDVTVNQGVTLTIAAGTAVTVAGSESLADGGAASVVLVVKGTLLVQGSAASPVIFAADTGGTWRGIGVASGGSATVEHLVETGAITGIDFAGTGSLGDSSIAASDTCIRVHQTGSATVTNAMLVSGGTGLDNSGSVTASHITVQGGSIGISMGGGDTEISYALVTATSSAAVSLGSSIYPFYSGKGSLTHSTLADNAGGGIVGQLMLGSVLPTSFVIADDVIASNGGAGIDTGFALGNSAPLNVSHSDIWNNTRGDEQGKVQLDAASFSAAPLFVGNGNYHLTDRSPCRNAGDDGNDIGALPYAGDATTGGLRGTLFKDTTLSGSVIVDGDLTVAKGATLTLSPGASLTFAASDALKSGVDKAHVELIVLGSLAVAGQSGSVVTLAGENGAQWYGVRSLAGSATDVRYAALSGALVGFTLGESATIASSSVSAATGVDIKAGSSTLLADTFQGCATAGLVLENGNATITTASFLKNGDGIEITGGTAIVDHALFAQNTTGLAATGGAASLEHATIAANTGHGVQLALTANSAASFAVKDSIVAQNGGHGIAASNPPSGAGFPQTDHNDVYGNAGGDVAGVVPAQAMAKDPLFTASGWRLTAGSPCIGAGNGGSDLGAFSFGAAGAVDHIAVLPAAPTVSAGAAVTFSAQAYDAAGNPVTATFTWSALAAAGTIDQSGNLTAACAPGAIASAVTASAGGRSGSTGLTIQAGPAASVAISPASASLVAGGAAQFSAAVVDQCGNPSAGTIAWSATQGAIDQSGKYQAPCTTGLLAGAVVARSGTLQKSADVTVSAGPLSQLHVRPENASVPQGAAEQYAATGTDTCLNTVPTGALSWTVEASAGSISSAGLFTAGTRDGTYTVSAQAQGAQAATKVTVVDAGGPAVDSIAVDPGSLTLDQGATQTFTATARDANGILVSANFTWSATGGIIDTAGHFTAGTVAGTFSVAASASGKTGAVNVTIRPGGPAGIHLTPDAVTIAPGGVTSFSATVTDASGNPTADPIVFSCNPAAGTISAGGVFVAGSNAGIYPNAIVATAGSLQAKANGTISPTALAQLVLQPIWPSVRVGSSVQFTASGLDGAGRSVPVSATWSMLRGGGSISAGGVFSAGQVPGTWLNSVQAVANGVAALTSVVTTPGPAVLITVSPARAILSAGATQRFTAKGTDVYGNETAATGVVWSADPRAGSIDGQGNFTAGAAPGDYENAVVATFGTIAGGAAVTIGEGNSSDGGVSDGGATPPAASHRGCTSAGGLPALGLLFVLAFRRRSKLAA